MATLDDTVARLVAIIEQSAPDVDVSTGTVLRELLIKLAATLHTEQYNLIETLSLAKSIGQVTESPEDTYSLVLDQIASNFNLTRLPGSFVQGVLKLTVANSAGLNLSKGAKFVQPALGLTYTVTSDIRARTEPDTSLGETQLFNLGGIFYALIPVVAEAVGGKYQIPNATALTPGDDVYVSGFVKAEAFGNFTSGTSKETDKELVVRIRRRLGVQSLQSESGIENHFSTTFPSFRGLVACGANDQELVRARHNALGISTFGKADIYVRGSLGPEVKTLTKLATRTTSDLWELNLLNSDAPGFYDVLSILPVSAGSDFTGSLSVESIEYGYAYYPGERNNEIYSVRDARFTKYQTARVLFHYADTPPTPIGTTLEFNIQLLHTPSLLEMQNILLNDGNRVVCADYLVKGVVPCFVSLELSLVKKNNTDTYESLGLQDLKADIFNYINSLPFGSELQSSSLIDLCHNYGIKRVNLPIVIEGVLLCPSGNNLTIRSEDVLTIPSNPEAGVSPRNVAHFIDYFKPDGDSVIDNIGINLQ